LTEQLKTESALEKKAQIKSALTRLVVQIAIFNLLSFHAFINKYKFHRNNKLNPTKRVIKKRKWRSNLRRRLKTMLKRANDHTFWTNVNLKSDLIWF